MKRALLFLIVTVAAISVVGAAGRADQGSAEERGRRDVTLPLSSSQGWIFDVDKDIADMFAEESGITIDWQISPDDQYVDILRVKLNAKEAPDIFMLQSSTVNMATELDPVNNCVDLTNEEWVSRLDPGIREDSSLNGRVYGLRLWRISLGSAYTYNGQVFDRLGLEEPGSYDEFKALCEELKNAGIVPIYQCIPAGWHHVVPLFNTCQRIEQLRPGTYEALNNNEIKLAEIPEFVELLGQFKEFADRGYYGDEYLSNSYEGAAKAIVEERYAMVFNNSGWIREVATNYPEVDVEEWGMFQSPWIDNRLAGVSTGGPTKFIYKESDLIEEAKAYFDFITRLENLELYLEKANDGNFTQITFPEAGAKTADMLPGEKQFVDFTQEHGMGNIMQNGVKYINPQWFDVGKDLELLFLGEMTPLEVAQSIDRRRRDQALALKDPAWM